MRLIDADAAAEQIRDEIIEAHGIEAAHGFIVGLRLALAYVYAAETIDAEPVRHGRWKRISPAGIYECSKCGQEVMTSDIDVYNYCHGCGAKMDASEGEAAEE